MRLKSFLGIGCLLLSLYLINGFFDFFKIPEFFLSIESWVYLVSGIILGFLGLKMLFFKKSSEALYGV